jgi:hypothetical protein
MVALEAERKARELERLEKSKKQSVFGKLFGGTDAEPVVTPPVAPVKPLAETRVRFACFLFFSVSLSLLSLLAFLLSFSKFQIFIIRNTVV